MTVGQAPIQDRGIYVRKNKTVLKPEQEMALRRQRATQREMAVENVKRQSLDLALANWEIRTDETIRTKNANKHIEKLAEEREAKLLARKRSLAHLFNYEMESWQNEIINNLETPMERKTKLREKAFALRDKRESDRREYVQKCYDRQWRDACDDARLLDGKALLQYVTDERINQIHEKSKKKIQDKIDDEKHQAYLKEKMDEMQARENAIAARKKEMATRTKEDLNKQIIYNAERKKKLKERIALEDKDELERLMVEIAAEEAKIYARTVAAHERGKEVKEFNKKRLGIREAEAQREREEDIALLNYALAKEKETADAEESKKELEKQTTRQYQEYLRLLMIKEAQDNSGVEALRKEQEDKVWKKREDELKRQDDARAFLMAEVDAGRKEQLRLQALQKIEDKKIDGIMLSKFAKDHEEGVKKDQDELEFRKKEALYNQQYLNDQIQLKRNRERAEKQKEYLVKKHMESFEKTHHERQLSQAGKPILHRPLPHSQWYY